MKRKIYSIVSLLSFLIVFWHGVMPHEHPELLASEIFTHLRHHETHPHLHNINYHSSPSDKHEGQQPQKKDHDHNFPQHYHHSVTEDFDFTRANQIEFLKLPRYVNFFTYSEAYPWEIFEPPNSSDYSYTDKPFLISSHSKPGANALRAPPSAV